MHQLLASLRTGQDWRQARYAVFRNGSFGNGSAMRVGPLGAYFHDAAVDEVVAQAALSAEVTHSRPEAKAGAVAVALAAWLAARARNASPSDPHDSFAAIQPHLTDGLAVSASVARAGASNERSHEGLVEVGVRLKADHGQEASVVRRAAASS
jgi:ADP-ribosylglycohydrolase